MTPKVLIVDDEAHIRLLIEQTLEELEDKGVELLTAVDGAEAIDLIQTARPRVVFLDVMMPKVNGFEVCQVVKHDLNLAEINIVLLTAKGQAADRQKGAEVGADAYLTKPFDPDELYQQTLTLLGMD